MYHIVYEKGVGSSNDNGKLTYNMYPIIINNYVYLINNIIFKLFFLGLFYRLPLLFKQRLITNINKIIITNVSVLT